MSTLDGRDSTARGSAPEVASLLQPRYVFVRQPLRFLALGDVVVEPALGLVRVAAIRLSGGEPFVRVYWREDHGPCTAAVRYAGDTVLPVRSPAPADRMLVGHGIDRATYLRREIDSRTARLIAAHLHRWPESPLHRFAFTGKVRGQIGNELDQVARDCRPFLRPWADALGQYCHAWRTGAMTLERLVEPPAATAKPTATRTPNTKRHRTQMRFPELLTRKTVRSELALELIDAAFELGLAAGRSGLRTADRRP